MWRQSGRGILAGSLFALAACGGGGPEQGDIGFIEGFFGGLIADEPRAALIGRDVLSAGGTAADAAVAAYFTMSVTLPGAASIGGGGVCLVHDAVEGRTETVSFMPKRPADPDARYSVPGNVRGMFLLHARFGQLAWSDLLLPAEDFARSGHALSRAFVRDFEAARPIVTFGEDAREIFGVATGGVAEGRLLQQLELGAVISNLRTKGPGSFYDGGLGRSFVEAVGAAGGKLTLDDLRNYRPQFQEPIRFEQGNNFVAFAGDGGGQVAAQIWEAATDEDRYEDADGTARIDLMAALSRRASQAVTAGTADAVSSGANIVAVDNQGRTVACSFTMNGPFGSGEMAPGTGILLAPLPDPARASAPTAVLMANELNGFTFFAAAGSGSGMTSAVVTRVALETIVGGDGNMLNAVALPRVFNTGNPDVTVVEAAMPDAQRAALEGLGHSVEQTQSIGRVNGFFCPEGLPRGQTCQFVKDSRSFGLAVSADE